VTRYGEIKGDEMLSMLETLKMERSPVRVDFLQCRDISSVAEQVLRGRLERRLLAVPSTAEIISSP
jgi:hypothetical protein